MQLGLAHVNMGWMSRPEAVAEGVRAAEAAGFDSLWAGEHVILPDPQVPPSPMSPQDPALDSLLALTWAAAHTSVIRLATGILILPQRNPVVLAKQVATLDVLSGGRVILGVGAGYLEPEFRAVGARFAERGAVTDEYLDAMAALWYSEHPAYQGRFASFSGVDARPRPVQQPIALVVGGHSAPAYRRAMARAHGWYGYWLTPGAGRRVGYRSARRRGPGRAGRRAGRAGDQRDAARADNPGGGGAIRRGGRAPAGAGRTADGGRAETDDRGRPGRNSRPVSPWRVTAPRTSGR
jgi:probable F420-dependent oxidoreductase